jgi:uncharacterized metal-binding protein
MQLNTVFYLEYLQFNATSAGNAGCLKNSFTIYSKCCSVSSVTKTFKGVQTIHRSGCWLEYHCNALFETLCIFAEFVLSKITLFSV